MAAKLNKTYFCSLRVPNGALPFGQMTLHLGHDTQHNDTQEEKLTCDTQHKKLVCVTQHYRHSALVTLSKSDTQK